MQLARKYPAEEILPESEGLTGRAAFVSDPGGVATIRKTRRQKHSDARIPTHKQQQGRYSPRSGPRHWPASPSRKSVWEAELEVTEFGLAQERYAVETIVCGRSLSIGRFDAAALRAGVSVRGLVNVRGRILPVIDLKKFFDLPDEGITDLHRVLLIQHAGDDVWHIGGHRHRQAVRLRLKLTSISIRCPRWEGFARNICGGVTGGTIGDS